MKHDAECENHTPILMWNGMFERVGCRCAERAYAHNPLPDCPLPDFVALHDTDSNRIGERSYLWQSARV
jgi:hypothetical protein